jgi:hypothetical protein
MGYYGEWRRLPNGNLISGRIPLSYWPEPLGSIRMMRPRREPPQRTPNEVRMVLLDLQVVNRRRFLGFVQQVHRRLLVPGTEQQVPWHDLLSGNPAATHEPERMLGCGTDHAPADMRIRHDWSDDTGSLTHVWSTVCSVAQRIHKMTIPMREIRTSGFYGSPG